MPKKNPFLKWKDSLNAIWLLSNTTTNNKVEWERSKEELLTTGITFKYTCPRTSSPNGISCPRHKRFSLVFHFVLVLWSIMLLLLLSFLFWWHWYWFMSRLQLLLLLLLLLLLMWTKPKISLFNVAVAAFGIVVVIFAAPTRSCLLLSKLNNTIYVLFSIWLHSAFDIQFRFGAIPLHSIRIRIDAVFMFIFGAWTNMSLMLFSWFCYFVLKEL